MGLLEELAVRCEAATGADRDIDGWVFCALNPDQTTVVDHEPGRFPRTPIYGNISIIMDRIGGKDGAEYLCAPLYTSSIDAAMTLMPIRSVTSLAKEERWRSPKWTWAVNDEIGVTHFGNAATPALALTAASLRARHALALSEGSDT